MTEVEPIGVELWDGAGGDDDAGRVGLVELEDVESGEEGAAKGCRDAVVGWGGECEEVDERLGLGAGDCASDVRTQRRDGDSEKC